MQDHIIIFALFCTIYNAQNARFKIEKKNQDAISKLAFCIKTHKMRGEPPHKEQSPTQINKFARNQTLSLAQITIEILPPSHRP